MISIPGIVSTELQIAKERDVPLPMVVAQQGNMSRSRADAIMARRHSGCMAQILQTSGGSDAR